MSASREKRSDSLTCMVCCQPSNANCELDPCRHSPACNECSVKMLNCLVCDSFIVRRLMVLPMKKDDSNKPDHKPMNYREDSHRSLAGMRSVDPSAESLPDNKTMKGGTFDSFLNKQEPDKREECLVCSKVSKVGNSPLQPCGHSPACEPCSAKLTDCLICDQHIERHSKTLEEKYSKSGAALKSGGESFSKGSYFPETPESKNCCLICFGKENVSLFDKGPAWAARLYFCITCKQTIANRIKGDGSLTASPLKDPVSERVMKIETSECMVCHKTSKVNRALEPCGHRPACIDCSTTLKSCLICMKATEQRTMASTGAIFKPQPAQVKIGPHGVKSTVRPGVQDRWLKSLEENTVQYNPCEICHKRMSTMAFQCHHSACSECASRLSTCLVCKQVITNRTKIQGSVNVLSKVQPLKTKSVECLVCCKTSEANTILEPCGHAPACEACSAGMEQCLICDGVIKRLQTTDRMCAGGIRDVKPLIENKSNLGGIFPYINEKERHQLASNLVNTDDEQLAKSHVEKKTLEASMWKQDQPNDHVNQCYTTAVVKTGYDPPERHIDRDIVKISTLGYSNEQERHMMSDHANLTYSNIASLNTGVTSTNKHLKEVKLQGGSGNFEDSNHQELVLAPTTDECLLCNKVSKANHVLPCGHKPTCETCSAGLTQCLVCDAMIAPQRAIMFNNNDDVSHRSPAFVACNDGSNFNIHERTIAHFNDTLVGTGGVYQEDSSNGYFDGSSDPCLICAMRKSSTEFQCGHKACPECASWLVICHICEKPISNRVQNDSSLPYNECWSTDGHLIPHKGNVVARIGQSSGGSGEDAGNRCCLCLLPKTTITFPCGHSACRECTSQLSACHICKRRFEKKPRNNERIITSVKCMVCHKTCEQICYLLPCGHGPTCEDCAAGLTNCFLCRKVIERRVTADNCEVPYHEKQTTQLKSASTSDRIRHAMHSSVEEAIKNNPLIQCDDGQNAPVIICKVDVQVVQSISEQRAKDSVGTELQLTNVPHNSGEIEYAQRFCKNCGDFKEIVVFQCSHDFCAECAVHKSFCHECNLKITDKSYIIV